MKECPKLSFQKITLLYQAGVPKDESWTGEYKISCQKDCPLNNRKFRDTGKNRQKASERAKSLVKKAAEKFCPR